MTYEAEKCLSGRNPVLCMDKTILLLGRPNAPPHLCILKKPESGWPCPPWNWAPETGEGCSGMVPECSGIQKGAPWTSFNLSIVKNSPQSSEAVNKARFPSFSLVLAPQRRQLISTGLYAFHSTADLIPTGLPRASEKR